MWLCWPVGLSSGGRLFSGHGLSLVVLAMASALRDCVCGPFASWEVEQAKQAAGEVWEFVSTEADAPRVVPGARILCRGGS